MRKKSLFFILLSAFVLGGCTNNSSKSKIIKNESESTEVVDLVDENKKQNSKNTANGEVKCLISCKKCKELTGIFGGVRVVCMFEDKNTIIYSKNNKTYIGEYSLDKGITNEGSELFVSYSSEYFLKDKKIIIVDNRRDSIMIYAYDIIDKSLVSNEIKFSEDEEKSYLSYDIENDYVEVFDDEKCEIVEYYVDSGKVANKIKIDDKYIFTKAVKGKKGYSFYGGVINNENEQAVPCYGFVDFKGNIKNVQYMDSSWEVYKNGIIVYEMTLSWTGKNKVIFLDANTFETKSVKINSDLEAKNEIRITYDGNYLITDSSDIEKNEFSKHVYSVEENKEIGNIDFTRCNDCMIYMSSVVAENVKSLLFSSEYKSGKYEIYKYNIK